MKAESLPPGVKILPFFEKIGEINNKREVLQSSLQNIELQIEAFEKTYLKDASLYPSIVSETTKNKQKGDLTTFKGRLFSYSSTTSPLCSSSVLHPKNHDEEKIDIEGGESLANSVATSTSFITSSPSPCQAINIENSESTMETPMPVCATASSSSLLSPSLSSSTTTTPPTLVDTPLKVSPVIKTKGKRTALEDNNEVSLSSYKEKRAKLPTQRKGKDHKKKKIVKKKYNGVYQKRAVLMRGYLNLKSA